MERVKLVVSERNDTGSRESRRLRKSGVIPGVLYGAGEHAVPIAIDSKDFRTAVTSGQGTHAVFDVVLEGRKKEHHAVIQEMQLDKIKHVVTHIDLREVKLTEAIETSVGLQIDGDAPGVKTGGLLETVIHEIQIKALPGDIPERLVIDVSEMEMGDTARV